MIPMLLLGSLVVASTIVLHGLGTAMLIDHLRRTSFARIASHRLKDSLFILSFTGVGLLFIHAVQVIIWALVYYYIGHVDELATFEEAVYFSVVTFTTLGYGDITLSIPWRTLSGIQAMNGTLLFGWSAALLFVLVQKLWSAPGKDRVRD